MEKLRVSESYRGCAWIEDLNKSSAIKRIRITQRAGLGFIVVLDEMLDLPTGHIIKLRFFEEDAIGNARLDTVRCTRYISIEQLNNIVHCLTFDDLNIMKKALADIFWMPINSLINPPKENRKLVNIRNGFRSEQKTLALDF